MEQGLGGSEGEAVGGLREKHARHKEQRGQQCRGGARGVLRVTLIFQRKDLRLREAPELAERGVKHAAPW